jgi:putative acetyltransferase
MRLLLTLLLVVACVSVGAGFDVADVDRTISGQSAYPIASNLSKVGRYPPVVKSGAGYFYDDVLEYRVWLHPERGAEKKNGNDDYFVAFAQYEKALEFSKRAQGSEQPLVLIRQLKHINEPKPGVFEVIEGERITEWQVPWLAGSKRLPGRIEKFLQDHRK